MAYNFSRGRQIVGDLSGSDDSGRDTGIDFEDDYIGFQTSGSARMVVSGSKVGVGTTSPSTTFHAYANVSNEYVATIDNDQASSGHVLRLQTDGNGSGSRLLEMEDGDGDVIFRARADGRFGFGPDGVSSMGAGTFVVGIDNSSHTSDIAISQRLQHLGDSNTYLDFPSADTFNLVAGGNSFLKYDGNILINNANADVDTKIMADNGNVVLHVDAGTNRVGVGTTSPIAELDVAGKIAITSESSTPSQPSDGQGYLYTKSDGKIYWRSYDVSETDLTSGGAASAGGPDGAVQINDSNSLTGSAGFTYDGEEVYASGSVRIVGNQKFNDPGYSSGHQANRSFTFKRHYNISSISANNWTNVVSWRPYVEGTTNDPNNNTLWTAVSFKMEISGHTSGVANGFRSRMGYVSYEGSSAANASASDTTYGNPISTDVNRSGWVTTLRINPNQAGATGFSGIVYVEIHFARGEGSNGESIVWSIT